MEIWSYNVEAVPIGWTCDNTWPEKRNQPNKVRLRQSLIRIRKASI